MFVGSLAAGFQVPADLQRYRQPRPGTRRGTFLRHLHSGHLLVSSPYAATTPHIVNWVKA